MVIGMLILAILITLYVAWSNRGDPPMVTVHLVFAAIEAFVLWGVSHG